MERFVLEVVCRYPEWISESWWGNLFQPFFQPIDLPQIRFTVTPKAEDVRPVSILRQVGGCHMFFCGRYWILWSGSGAVLMQSLANPHRIVSKNVWEISKYVPVIALLFSLPFKGPEFSSLRMPSPFHFNFWDESSMFYHVSRCVQHKNIYKYIYIYIFDHVLLDGHQINHRLLNFISTCFPSNQGGAHSSK